MRTCCYLHLTVFLRLFTLNHLQPLYISIQTFVKSTHFSATQFYSCLKAKKELHPFIRRNLEPGASGPTSSFWLSICTRLVFQIPICSEFEASPSLPIDVPANKRNRPISATATTEPQPKRMKMTDFLNTPRSGGLSVHNSDQIKNFATPTPTKPKQLTPNFTTPIRQPEFSDSGPSIYTPSATPSTPAAITSRILSLLRTPSHVLIDLDFF